MAILQRSAATNQGFQSIVIKDNTNPYFIYSMGSKIKKKAEGIASGSTFLEISGKMLGNLEIAMPASREQDKIACYFEQLDDLITLHQREQDVSAGSTILINGKNNTSTWEQRKVGELLVERNEQASMSEEYPLMAFIANEGVAPKGDRYDRSSLVSDTENKLYKRTEFGDFIYSSNNLETGSIV